jgi:N-acetylglucosaminyldiphosphoundecaprenol N-acetyl-beta-D-mannosaminyltransferase
MRTDSMPSASMPSASIPSDSMTAHLEARIHRVTTTILDTRIDALSWEQLLGRIVRWAQAGQSRMICLCNVHSVVTAKHDAAMANALKRADLNLPDGAPIAWLMRQRSWPEQQRLSGPDLMWQLMREAEKLQLSVFLMGATPATLGRLIGVLSNAFPRLMIAGSLSPPFRPLNELEHRGFVDQINRSGASIVLIGLGCPKQEIWMAECGNAISAVMIGVGAAFDYHAGSLRRAPPVWQRIGLEWLYRLLQEPRRLARRYLLTNTLFLLALPAELWRSRQR